MDCRLEPRCGGLAQEFAVELHERTVGKLLRKLSFRGLSVRPQHPQGKAEPGGFQHSFAVDETPAMDSAGASKPSLRIRRRRELASSRHKCSSRIVAL